MRIALIAITAILLIAIVTVIAIGTTRPTATPTPTLTPTPTQTPTPTPTPTQTPTPTPTSAPGVDPQAEMDKVVNFPDPNLEAVIRGAIEKPTGDIYESDLVRLRHLRAIGRDIIDLTGLEYCTSLTTLWLSVNQISDIALLSNLVNLFSLYLGWNHISDVSPLSNLTSLIILDLRTNQISDISALSSLTSLTKLYLSSNQISDISVLSSFTSLTDLYLHNNQISDIFALSSLTSLTKLYLHNNQISDVSPLSSLPRLTRLYLYGNQISDVSPLVANAGLSKGDYIPLGINPLSADSVNIYIPELRGRGVSVVYPFATADCFIATAAYGTSTAEELDTLRAFRDEVLLQNSLGSRLVNLYYEVSPPVADFISDHEPLRTLVRELLVAPVAWLVEATGTLWRD